MYTFQQSIKIFSSVARGFFTILTAETVDDLNDAHPEKRRITIYNNFLSISLVNYNGKTHCMNLLINLMAHQIIKFQPIIANQSSKLQLVQLFSTLKNLLQNCQKFHALNVFTKRKPYSSHTATNDNSKTLPSSPSLQYSSVNPSTDKYPLNTIFDNYEINRANYTFPLPPF